MKLDTKAFAIAAGVAAAVVSAACALIVAIAPEFATALFSDVVHVDLTGLARNVSWSNFFGGLIFWGLGTGVVFAFGAWLYNRLTGSTAA